MTKPHPPLLEYNSKNLKRVSRAIVRNLTPDLLPKKYIAINETNKAFGHCHTAAGCLYRIFGSQQLHMYRSLDNNNIWHWWVQDRQGTIVDLTASQYPETTVRRLYKRGEKSGMLGFKYRENVKIALERVCRDLKIAVPAFCQH